MVADDDVADADVATWGHSKDAWLIWLQQKYHMVGVAGGVLTGCPWPWNKERERKQ